MPLLELNELEKISSVFRGRGGNLLARGLMHVLGVDDVNDLYDRNSYLRGVEFADAVLKDVGLEYTIGYEGEVPDSLEDLLPAGPSAYPGEPSGSR